MKKMNIKIDNMDIYTGLPSTLGIELMCSNALTGKQINMIYIKIININAIMITIKTTIMITIKTTIIKKSKSIFT
jgi:hypothetical protein